MNNKQLIKIWSRVLEESAEGKSLAEQRAIVAKLKTILARKKKQHLLPLIVKNAARAAEKQARLEIILAHEQPSQTLDKITQKFARELDSEKTVQITLNPELIGGFVVKTSQYLVDVSVKNYLMQLRHSYRD